MNSSKLLAYSIIFVITGAFILSLRPDTTETIHPSVQENITQDNGFITPTETGATQKPGAPQSDATSAEKNNANNPEQFVAIKQPGATPTDPAMPPMLDDLNIPSPLSVPSENF